MKRVFKTLGALLLVSMTAKADFLPRNGYLIPVGQGQNNEMNEQVFNNVLDRIQRVYAPLFQQKNLTLNIRRRWSDPTVNAYAEQSGRNAYITMFGGLARHRAITPDAFALVACHEIGHHIGGTPKVEAWATNEGQSDYFGTLKCLRRYFVEGQQNSFANNLTFVNMLFQGRSHSPQNFVQYRQNFMASDYAVQACKTAFKDVPNQVICVRSAAAGMSLALLFQDLEKRQTPPRYETPDRNRVPHTDHDHPASQCRLDTYFQGALCAVSVLEDIDNSNPHRGTCTEARGFKLGLRPLCWYNPQDVGQGQYKPQQAFNGQSRIYP